MSKHILQWQKLHVNECWRIATRIPLTNKFRMVYDVYSNIHGHILAHPALSPVNTDTIFLEVISLLSVLKP